MWQAVVSERCAGRQRALYELWDKLADAERKCVFGGGNRLAKTRHGAVSKPQLAVEIFRQILRVALPFISIIIVLWVFIRHV